MNSTLVIIIEGLIVLAAIALGVRYKGLSIGLFGGLGVLILVVLFGEAPGSLPTSAIFIILSVVTAAATMQVAGGVDWLVVIARDWIKRRPSMITFVAPYVSGLFTLGAGTGNIYYSCYRSSKRCHTKTAFGRSDPWPCHRRQLRPP